LKKTQSFSIFLWHVSTSRNYHCRAHQNDTAHHTKTLAERKEEDLCEAQGQAALSRWRHVMASS
jgi:hypothetical protein